MYPVYHVQLWGEILKGIPRAKTPLEETEQASEPDMAGMWELSDREL